MDFAYRNVPRDAPQHQDAAKGHGQIRGLDSNHYTRGSEAASSTASASVMRTPYCNHPA
jgi:hypothetical protein